MSARPRDRPPRLARALLRWLLPDRAREFVIGDLDEEYATRILPARGRGRANRWYWRQTVASLRAVRRSGPERPAPSPPRELMSTTLQDARFALRSWHRNPGTTLLALVALALGIGANTAIFSVVHGVLLSPLPYPEPERLTTVWLDNRLQGWHQDVTSYPNYEDWAAWNETFSGMAAFVHRADTVVLGAEPRQVLGGQVTPGFFEVLGVEPLFGRTFTRTDWEQDRQPVVLAHGTWTRRYGADPEVLGTTLTLDGEPHVVVGVMPPGFHYLREDAAHWRLFPSTITESGRGQLWLQVVGRLAPGVTLEQARADMDRVGRRLEEAHRDYNEGYGVTLVPVREHIVGDVRPALLVLLGTVALVLLIACANVANLMLSRAIARRREIAVRAALGASGGRIVRQTLTESLLLALTGGALGVGLAVIGLRVLRELQPALPRLAEVGLNVPVLLFTLGTATVTGLLFGTIPALQARSRRLADALRDRSGAAGSSSGGLRNGLVVAEIALALVLLVGAGLLARSYASLLSVAPGFESAGVLTFRVSLTGPAYETADSVRGFFLDALSRVDALSGSRRTAAIWHLPLGGRYASAPVSVEGEGEVPRSERREIKYNIVTAEAFDILGIPVLRGRGLSAADTADGELVVVINETFARSRFGDEDPIGRRLVPGSPDDYLSEDDPEAEVPWMRIVGIVGDVKQRALARPTDPEIFAPFHQNPEPTMSFVVATEGDPAGLTPEVRQAIWDVDPALPVTGIEPLEALLRRDTARERFNLTLIGLFAALAGILATIGIYGVVAYWVRQQTRDIGVRMALGARAGDVRGMVLGHTARIALIGIAIGLAGALVASRSISSLLFGVEAADPVTFATVAMVAAAMALATAWFPARRATRIDPIEALRED